MKRPGKRDLPWMVSKFRSAGQQASERQCVRDTQHHISAAHRNGSPQTRCPSGCSAPGLSLPWRAKSAAAATAAHRVLLAPVGASRCGPRCMSSVKDACGSPKLRAHVSRSSCAKVGRSAFSHAPQRRHLRYRGHGVDHVRAPLVHRLRPLRKRLRVQREHTPWAPSKQAGRGLGPTARRRTLGTTAGAFSSAKRVEPAAGRAPTRQKKRHLGSGPLGMVARCSAGCASTVFAHSGSTFWRVQGATRQRRRASAAGCEPQRTRQRGTSTSSGVAPTW